MGGEGGGDEDDAFGFGLGGGGEGGEELLGERGLLGDEAEACGGVVAEEVADDSVAEGADAVVEDDVAGFELGVLKIGHGCVERVLALLYWSRCLEC